MQRIKSLLLLLLFSSSLASAQGYISPRLQKQLNQEGTSFLTVRIEFENTVDLEVLKADFKQNGYTPSERAKRTLLALQNQANFQQQAANRLITEKLQEHIKAVYPFWIVNVMVLQADKYAIEALSQTAHVNLIDLEESQFISHDPILKSGKHKTQAPGGVEPGLTAINAPAMWALGYTGRGRVVYNYDTGVWPTHPSFNNRFMANFYPLSQSWYGFFSETPNGNVSDHGTHTLGTIAGLDAATQDTIGVAFEAYWIANDFVTSTVQALPPLVDMIGAFQWALNPDGDINTTHDIPDVINNSWRWYDVGDTVHCGGFVVNLMNAIEAAGIANVFSGGNFGPSNTTISSPQRINTSNVNTFSVGSIDANQSFPYPISGFSSKGPTQCPGTGSLSIHPEVVAPGQNVRSAWGKDSYNSISGTSMAAPHVSGAILLLKEAFPFLNGDELLMALYTTATDMGTTGEDNTYGNGLIDVYAAYQHLAQSHTPVDPNQIAWDLAITDLSSPALHGVTCDASYIPQITLLNRGDSAITKINFGYKVNSNGLPVGHTWTGNLTSGQSINISLPSVSFTGFGPQELEMLVSVDPQKTEYDNFNNRKIIRFNRRESVSLPFTEEFENGISDHWLVLNEDGARGWDTISVPGRGTNTKAARIDFYNYHPRASQRDGLITPQLSIPTTGQSTLKFDVSYQNLNPFSQLQDTLRVYASTDCGASFPQLIYEKFSGALNTNDTTTNDFIPQYESHWRRDSIDLQAFAGQDILLQIMGINRKGNNLYIDNVSVYSGATDPVSSEEERETGLYLYPNPAQNQVKIEAVGLGEGTFEVQFIDAVGRVVKSSDWNKADAGIDIRDLKKGIYIVQLNSPNKTYTSRLVKH
jgi:bacillopeptidase F